MANEVQSGKCYINSPKPKCKSDKNREDKIQSDEHSQTNYISKCAIFTYCSRSAWPWVRVWHDDMPSTLMVYDGIKALSGAHRRCLEPRPWVALHRWRAVISVPCCQKSSPFLPTTLSICSISRGRVGAMHFPAIRCCALGRSHDQSATTINTSSSSQCPKNTAFFFFLLWTLSICNKKTPFRQCTRSKGQSCHLYPTSHKCLSTAHHHWI